MSLRMNIHTLTREHYSRDHAGRLARAIPLLEQLTAGAGNAGGSAGSETPLPVSVSAIALWQDLEFEAKDIQYRRTGNDRGGLWEITAGWSGIDDPEHGDPHWAAYLEDVTGDWIVRITELINPVSRSRRPLRRPCAACGNRWHWENDSRREAVTAWVWDEEGEIAPVDLWEVSCRACGGQWIGREVAATYWAGTTPAGSL